VKHHYAEFLLEFGNLAAQRGLRNVYPRRGAREAAGVDDSHKVTQLTQVNDGILYIRRRSLYAFGRQPESEQG